MCSLAVQSLGSICQRLPFFDHWYWVLAYLGIEVSTAEARSNFAEELYRQTLLLTADIWVDFRHACHTHQENLAAIMMKDVIAEPYRQQLLPNFAEVKTGGARSGALATGIS